MDIKAYIEIEDVYEILEKYNIKEQEILISRYNEIYNQIFISYKFFKNVNLKCDAIKSTKRKNT